MALAARPRRATAIIRPDATSGGADSRRQASNRMNAAIPNSSTAFATAAKISSLR